MNCPRCNALNPDDAKFCSLCLQRLGEDQTPAHTEHAPVVGPVEDDPQVQRAWELARTTAPSPGPDVVSGPIRKTQAGVTWFCPSCDTENPISVNLCKVCGSSFFDAFR